MGATPLLAIPHEEVNRLEISRPIMFSLDLEIFLNNYKILSRTPIFSHINPLVSAAFLHLDYATRKPIQKSMS